VIWKLTRWIRPWDALVLLRAGHDVMRGISPYPRSVHSPSVYGGHAFVYPYASAWVMGPLGALPTFVGQTVFLGTSIAALVGAWRMSRTRSTIVLLALLLSSTTVIALQIGSIEPLLLLGIVAAWRWRDRAWICGACIATVVVAKVFLLPLLAWLVLARRWRAAGVAVAVSAALLLAGWSLGPLGAPAYMHMLGALSRHESRQGWSFVGYMLRHGMAPAAADHLAIAVAGLTILAAWAVHLQSGSDETLLVGCVAASLFASPVVWAHYFVLLFLAPLIIRLPRLVAATFAVVTWLVVLPHKVVVPHLGTWLTGSERAVAMQLLVVAVFAVVALRELRDASPSARSHQRELERRLPVAAGEAQLRTFGVGERHGQLEAITVAVRGRLGDERVEIGRDAGAFVLDGHHHSATTAGAHHDRDRTIPVHERVVEQHVEDL
jgi:hypothetical protein